MSSKEKVHEAISKDEPSNLVKYFSKWAFESSDSKEDKQKILDNFLGHACAKMYQGKLFPQSPKMAVFLIQAGIFT